MCQDLILLAVDMKKPSERAFDWYLQHMYNENHILGICHIVDSQHTVVRVPYSADIPGAAVEQAVKASWSYVDKLIEKYIEKCKARGAEVKYKVFIETGKSFGEDIIKVAERENATAIVLGNRGLSAFKSAFLGSVSNHVLHHSHVPVVITPPQDTKSEEAKK